MPVPTDPETPAPPAPAPNNDERNSSPVPVAEENGRASNGATSPLMQENGLVNGEDSGKPQWADALCTYACRCTVHAMGYGLQSLCAVLGLHELVTTVHQEMQYTPPSPSLPPLHPSSKMFVGGLSWQTSEGEAQVF